jgi:cobalamin biosynthesis Mg chelatase CobN
VPAPELLAPAPAATAGPARAGSSVRPATTEGGTDTAAALAAPAAEDGPASMAASGRASGAPVHGSPVSRSTASSSDGGAGAPVPYAVLLTALAAVLLFAGGVAPRRVAPPLAPTFLPPVFPG